MPEVLPARDIGRQAAKSGMDAGDATIPRVFRDVGHEESRRLPLKKRVYVSGETRKQIATYVEPADGHMLPL